LRVRIDTGRLRFSFGDLDSVAGSPSAPPR
jgi:hypothetical protein